MESRDIRDHVDMFVGVVNLNVFVHCVGVYRIEVCLLNSEMYIDTFETLYLSACDRKRAALAAYELILERAIVLNYEEIIIGKTNEPALCDWIKERNKAEHTGDGFFNYISDVSDLLRKSGHHLDSLRIENMYYPLKDEVTLKVLFQTPSAYAKYISE